MMYSIGAAGGRTACRAPRLVFLLANFGMMIGEYLAGIRILHRLM